MRLFIALVTACLTATGCAQTPTAGPTAVVQGDLHAVRSGDHGSPLIFIPGLSSGAWAWQPTAERFAKDHVVYVVTLAGFDGTAPAGPAPMAAAETAVMTLIDRQKIDRPVLIGHGMAGTMTLHLAELHADRLAGVVAFDGLPVFPRTDQLPLERRAAYAARARTSVPTDPIAYAASQEAFMTTALGVLDPAVGRRLAGLLGRSDPASVANYLADDVAADFRPGLAQITVPVLVVSPYNATDFTVDGRTLTEADKSAYYQRLMEGTPRLEVVSLSPARHFAMFDQPDRTVELIDRFVRSVGSQ